MIIMTIKEIEEVKRRKETKRWTSGRFKGKGNLGRRNKKKKKKKKRE